MKAKKEVDENRPPEYWVIWNPEKGFTAGSDSTTVFTVLAEIFSSEKKALAEQETWDWKQRGYRVVRKLTIDELDPRQMLGQAFDILCRHSSVNSAVLMDLEENLMDPIVRKRMFNNFLDEYSDRVSKPLDAKIVRLKAKLYDMEHKKEDK